MSDTATQDMIRDLARQDHWRALHVLPTRLEVPGTAVRLEGPAAEHLDWLDETVRPGDVVLLDLRETQLSLPAVRDIAAWALGHKINGVSLLVAGPMCYRAALHGLSARFPAVPGVEVWIS